MAPNGHFWIDHGPAPLRIKRKVMPRIEAFENYSNEYDEWFIKNKDKYQLELECIKPFIPKDAHGVEVGVGSGKFAYPLGIKVGVEPSRTMAKKARELGITVYDAVAEELPFPDQSFDFVLMVTTICFVDDILKAFREANRVLRPDGFIVIGFVDKESNLGRQYLKRKDKSKFYREAIFYSTKSVLEYLKKAGFGNFETRQTLLPEEKGLAIIDGYGKGGFVAIKATKLLQA